MANFKITKSVWNNQFYFKLQASGNYEPILSGEGYTTLASHLRGSNQLNEMLLTILNTIVSLHEMTSIILHWKRVMENLLVLVKPIIQAPPEMLELHWSSHRHPVRR